MPRRSNWTARASAHWSTIRRASRLPGGARSSTSRINVSDSALLLGISERLARKGGIGSFVVGLTSTESNRAPSGTDAFLHQLYLNYQTNKLEAYIGRTDTGTRLVDFPTVRGDDLNEFVNVLDPFSNGNNIQEHRYTNQATVVLHGSLRSSLNFHAQNLITSTPSSVGQGGINSTASPTSIRNWRRWKR